MTTKLSVSRIAELSGFSQSTVSRVLNNKPMVHPKTRETIIKLIEHEYPEQKVHFAQVFHKIGVVMEDIANSYFSRIARNIDNRLGIDGYSMLLTNSEYDERKEFQLVNMLLAAGVDGIILSAINETSPAVELLNKSEVPFMLINCKSDRDDIDWICSDNARGGYLATKYLLDNGHPRIAFIKGNIAQPAVERFEGFKAAIREHGLRLKDQLILDYGAATEEDGYRIMSNYIENCGKEELPTAIFAVNDPVAIGVMEALDANDIKTPLNVSVIGYDNIEISKFIKTPLSTVDQSEIYIGDLAASQIIEKHKSGVDVATRKILIKPKIIERESVSPYCETVTMVT